MTNLERAAAAVSAAWFIQAADGVSPDDQGNSMACGDDAESFPKTFPTVAK
jgi:hypothetical protein